MTSRSKKGTQIYYSFFSKVPANKPPLVSPEGPVYRGRPPYRAFCTLPRYYNYQSLSIKSVDIGGRTLFVCNVSSFLSSFLCSLFLWDQSGTHFMRSWFYRDKETKRCVCVCVCAYIDQSSQQKYRGSHTNIDCSYHYVVLYIKQKL
jgi:hypothetical protein